MDRGREREKNEEKEKEEENEESSDGWWGWFVVVVIPVVGADTFNILFGAERKREKKRNKLTNSIYIMKSRQKHLDFE